MKLNLKALSVATAALLAGGASLAANPVGFGGGNSSLAFVAMDNNGTPASLFVDLGFLFSDFAPGASLLTPGNTVSWNFNTNSVSVNGAAQPGTYNYSSQLTAFMQIAQAADVTYGVIAGSAAGYPDYFLTTGLPTATEVATQISSAGADNMRLVSEMYNKQAGLGTFGSTGFGAVALNGSDAAAVNNFGNFGPDGNWRLNLAWNATVAQGTANDLYFLDNDTYAVTKLAGQFNYDNGVLNFQTSPVPEPSAFMMAMAGLAVLGYAGRRREPR